MERKWLWIMYATVLLVLGGCGGSSSGGSGPDQPDVGMLTLVTDPADLEASIKAGFTATRDTQEDAVLGIASTGAAPQPDNFTGTYTQEANVDEFDAVRYDGEHLYVAPRRQFHCCLLATGALDDGAVITGNDPTASIRILATDPAGGTAIEQSAIPLEDGISVQGMYLTEDRMFALTAQNIYGGFGEFWADIALWAPEELGYRSYDVSDPTSPKLEVDVTIDGVFVESRRIGNIVYIVSRYAPSIDGIVYYVTTEAERAQNEALLANVRLDELLPTITVNGTTQSLVDPERCYIPSAAADIGYAVITSITAVPIDDPMQFTTTCYNEDAYGTYVSENAIYFTQYLTDDMAQQTSTRIHKFSVTGTTLDYRGSADIEGQVWRGGHADFRMNEYAGDLRVMASSYDWFTPDFVDHKLSILREDPAQRALAIVSELPNAQRPEEIGKPNEDLYGVRFLGERAYAVTFERIDPLYAIDLSNPADPFLAGALEIEGFSEFLHPVSDELLFGMGRATNGGLKLELFNVSDIAQPLSRGGVTLGEFGSFSEASYDRHAFTYQADVNGIDRLAIPANVYTNDGTVGSYNSALYLFEIHNKATPDLASLLAVGTIVPPLDQFEIPYIERNRSFIHNDTVYYIQNELVWSAFWQSPAVINGPF